VVINRKICPAGLKNNPNQSLKSVKFITIHTTGNYKATATAKSHAAYIYNGSAGARVSWHYSVDADSIWQHFEDNRACWHSGENTGNMTSLSIEICVNDKAVFKKACQNAAWLTAHLLKKHKLPFDSIVQHYRWNGKNCPAELRSGAWGVSWADFLDMVKENLAPKQPAVPVQAKPLYRVQVGAYTEKFIAEAMLARVKAAGFKDAIIK
jgi:N-acetylmuramoyl-L-alanine amidase CwlA